MRSTLTDKEIQEIIQKIVTQTLGDSPTENTQFPTGVKPKIKQEEVPTLLSKSCPVAIGADHGGVELKEILKETLISLSHEVIDCGTNNTDPVDYPDIAQAVSELVASGQAWRGVIIDSAGIGSCMAANKVPGVRAALCYDHASAVNSREHNNANVLTLGAGMIGINLAIQILKTWLSTEFGAGRHANRLDKIAAIEARYMIDWKKP